MLSTQQTPHTLEELMKKSDIDTMGVKALNKLITEATERLNTIKEQEVQAARAKIQEMAADLGLSIHALCGLPEPQEPRRGRPKGNGVRSPAKMKYKLPDGQEWSGKGRLPLSLRDALKGTDGYSEEDASFDSKEARAAALERFRIK